MKLSELIFGAGIKEKISFSDKEIKDVITDSNAITKGSLFVCLKGVNFDGHNFIRQAESYGAAAVVTERRLDTPLTQIVVEDGRKAISVIASNFYGNPAQKMRFIGVTGTNGKTTTAHLITSILVKSGIKCGLMGTLGVFYGGKFSEPTLTTPDPLEFHRILADMYKESVEAVVMEVSAHAAALRKLYGVSFDIAVFTNLTQDHLDFFGDMESYKRAKLDFLKDNVKRYTVTNADDPTGREIAEMKGAKTVTYGIENPSDVFAIDVKENPASTEFIMNLFDRIYDVKLNLIGRFNVYNALAASTAAALYGVSTDDIAEGLELVKCIDGRLQCVYDGDFSVYLDYAHTPDGLKKALDALRPHTRKRLICVFGCGGNRDKEKRPIMGRISGELADFTVLTTDNPRFEDAMDIIWQIESGIKQVTDKYVAIQERKDAIRYAVDNAAEGDTILIAGKGSEKYQEVFGIKRVYNDKDTVEEITGSIR